MEIITVIDGYTVVLEYESLNNCGAYSPELPGLAVGGTTREDVEEKMREGIPFHIEGLMKAGLPIPAPSGKFL